MRTPPGRGLTEHGPTFFPTLSLWWALWLRTPFCQHVEKTTGVSLKPSLEGSTVGLFW